MELVLDKAKLLAKKKVEMAKANAWFKLNLTLEKLFFSIPTKIDLINIASTTALDLMMKQLLKESISQEDTKFFLRTDPRAKAILNFTSTDINEDNLSEILLECYSENPEINISQLDENLDANDLFKTISASNNIDKNINKNKVKNLVSSISSAITSANALKEKTEAQLNQIGVYAKQASAAYNMALGAPDMIKAQIAAEKERVKQEIEQLKIKIDSYIHLLQHIIYVAKDLFTKTEHPSRYRTKYIQKLTRNLYALIKSELEQMKESSGKEIQAIKSQFEVIIAALKHIDDMLIVITLMTTVYLLNRVKLAKRSRETLKELAADIACISDISEPFDVSINKIPFQITLNCPVVTDDIIVPHTPISEKLKNLSCEFSQNKEHIVDAVAKEDLVTTAMIKNNKEKDKLKTKLTIDLFVDQKTKIATLGRNSIFSPVNGYISEINSDSIIIRDIEEPIEDYLQKQITLLNEKYEQLNYVKSFLKYYYVGSLYPIMLATAIVDDASTYDVKSGIETQWKDIKKEYFKIDKEYEKQIKKITGKDNVEKHAKNETLIEIKDTIEEQENIFYKNLELLNDKAINIAKKTKAKSNEYELFEFYVLDLGATFNGIENPNKIEIEFRNIINEFIRKRYVIDGYKKEKLKKKINEQIKDIESGISLGNWFDKAMEIYKSKNSLTELKTWLFGLANKNKKLEGNDKIINVNRVMFLFKLYLNVDQIVEKYTILAKETTPKTETIKEGNIIQKFTQDLWKEYESIPNEVIEIEKVIDKISMFSTYSIIEYKGKQTRLYTLADEPKCESKETDPYLNPKSQYGFGDINYWMKYCSFATLASVTNPATGWSTGWISPSPILMPVVYVPIKAIPTKTGFTVIGISICGIWIFPWVLFANLSINYTCAFGDPSAALKKEIQALKREISTELSNVKKVTLKPLIDKAKNDIEETQRELNDYKTQLKKYRSEKPSKYTSISDFKQSLPNFKSDKGNNDKENIKDTVEDIQTTVEAAKKLAEQTTAYVLAYEKWLKDMSTTVELIATTQLKIWKFQVKCALLQDAANYGKSIKGITDALDQTEKFINAQLDQLESMVDNMNNLLATLPIALSPETANFAMTIKNTTPIINIAGELDDNINTPVLDKFLEKFRLKNQDFLSSNYGNKLSGSILDYNTYKKELSAMMMLFIKKDPFPKYENLKPTNIPWLSFLYKDFVTTGATCYGFPGQLPLPI